MPRQIEDDEAPVPIHGARFTPDGNHAVLDIDFWRGQFPLEKRRDRVQFINGPGDLALAEQCREVALKNGPLGPSVKSDIFVWAEGKNYRRPWLTHLGGVPWREVDRPWPVDSHGKPLSFLAQICFADSRDVLPAEAADLPGEVLLFFGDYHNGSCGLAKPHIEWSNLNLSRPPDLLVHLPDRVGLPFTYQGVRHRTVQYLDRELADASCRSAGFRDGSWGIGAIQASQIGPYADVPQGWDIGGNCPGTLIAMVSSFYFRHQWPLCDAPTGDIFISADGEPSAFCTIKGLNFGIGDVGCLYVYRDAKGEYLADAVC